MSQKYLDAYKLTRHNRLMQQKTKVMKSYRGLEKPWLVIPKGWQFHDETPWQNGFKTWNEAMAHALALKAANEPR